MLQGPSPLWRRFWRQRIAWGWRLWRQGRFIKSPIQPPINSRNILGFQDSSTLRAQFGDINDVKWRKFEYRSYRSRDLQFRVRVYLIWSLDNRDMVEILKVQKTGKSDFGGNKSPTQTPSKRKVEGAPRHLRSINTNPHETLKAIQFILIHYQGDTM